MPKKNGTFNRNLNLKRKSIKEMLQIKRQIRNENLLWKFHRNIRHCIELKDKLELSKLKFKEENKEIKTGQNLRFGQDSAICTRITLPP